MTNVEMLQKLTAALDLIGDVHQELNDTATPCQCCGMQVRESYEDHQQKQALGAAMQRVEKAINKLRSGSWPGRELLPITAAETVRSER